MKSRVLVGLNQRKAFAAMLSRLNRKADRFGLEHVAVTSEERRRYAVVSQYVGRDGSFLLTNLLPVRDEDRGYPKVIELLEIEIEGPLIKLGDWTVIGRLEQAQSGVLSFGAKEGEDFAALAASADAGVRCEHCNTKRARKDAYVLRSATGEVITVGSSCLADYTGHDPGAALFLAELHSLVRIVMDELEDAVKSATTLWSVQEYMARVVNAIRHNGFVSAQRAESGFGATWQEALLVRPEDVIEDDRETACQIIERAMADTAQSGFARNVRVLVSADYVEPSPTRLAILAAAAGSHMRQLRAKGEHLGTIGAFWEGVVRVVNRVELLNTYGREKRWMLIFEAEAGGVLVWKTTAAPADLVQSVGPVSIKAKVKAHSYYEGMPQTSVTHLTRTQAEAA